MAIRSGRARDLLHSAADGAAFVAADVFARLWRHQPDRVLAAVHDYTPRSRIVHYLVQTVERTVLAEIVKTLAGDRAGAFLRLADRAARDAISQTRSGPPSCSRFCDEATFRHRRVCVSPRSSPKWHDDRAYRLRNAGIDCEPGGRSGRIGPMA